MRPPKFDLQDRQFFDYVERLEGLCDDARDLISNFPVYVGAVNLARFLTLTEAYTRVVDVAGHIADVGVYKGYSFMAFAKLVNLHEPHAATQVHGFDWFKDMAPGPEDVAGHAGKYVCDRDRLQELMELQGLAAFTHVHDLDLTRDLPAFLDEHPALRFKLVFVDCGMKAVLEAALPRFWERLVSGGVLMMDHYNNPTSPSKSAIVDAVIGERVVRQVAISRSPTAYVVK